MRNRSKIPFDVNWDRVVWKRAEAADDRRVCDAQGCDGDGDHRAPKSRDNLREYYWFCVDHVREYNASWNYFKGMSAVEVEDFQNSTSTWHRPTWQMGTGARDQGADRGVNDGFGLFEDEPAGRRQGGPGSAGSSGGEDVANEDIVRDSGFWSIQEKKALLELGLEAPVCLKEIKIRFKQLVKRHHPDANGGDTTAEDRLRRVIQAHDCVVKRLGR